MRWMCAPLSRHGNARSAEMVSPPASTDRVIEAGSTPGSATCMRISSGSSTTSTGGSQEWAAWVKNWRCRRSARSSIDSASFHIQFEKSRDLTGVKWRRLSGVQARRKNYACNTEGYCERTCAAPSRRRGPRFSFLKHGPPPSRGRHFKPSDASDLHLAEKPVAKRRDRGTIGNDLGTYKVISGLRLDV